MTIIIKIAYVLAGPKIIWARIIIPASNKIAEPTHYNHRKYCDQKCEQPNPYEEHCRNDHNAGKDDPNRKHQTFAWRVLDTRLSSRTGTACFYSLKRVPK